MPHDAQTSLSDFLSAVAAKQPAPGGGAVAALAGATAAAIGEMVLNYSIGRKGSAPFDDELRLVLAELTRARSALLALMVEDQDAFAELQAAKKWPDEAARSARVAEAVAVCIRVPQAIATTALVLLELADRVVEKSNNWLLSDLAVCAELAMATVRCGVHNVRANLGEVADAGRRATLDAECDTMLGRAVGLVCTVMAKIAAAGRSMISLACNAFP